MSLECSHRVRLSKLQNWCFDILLDQPEVKVLNKAVFLVLVKDILDLALDLDLLSLWFEVASANAVDLFEADLEEKFIVQQVLLLQLVDALGNTKICEELFQVEVDLLTLFLGCSKVKGSIGFLSRIFRGGARLILVAKLRKASTTLDQMA